MFRSAALLLAIAVISAVLVAWNASLFVGAKPRPRMKDLDFLPPPVVALALSLGQPTAAAKLRWIDSFAYFQFQLERQDDRVPGADGRGGVERLYDTLISLDPLFLPFYEHALLNAGGVLRHHQAALSFVLRGLLARPHETTLWRMASAELAVTFGWAKRRPVALDRWLAAWKEAEEDEWGRQTVEDWRRGLAFANLHGLETISYWMDRLRGTQPGTPTGDYVDGVLRELLAERGAAELTRLSGDSGVLGRILAQPLLPWAEVQVRIPAAALARAYSDGAPPWAPVTWDGRDGGLRPDPFGYGWRWERGTVVSVGREQRRFRDRTLHQRQTVEEKARYRGRPPRDRAEAAEWGADLPDPPYGGRWTFDEPLPDIAWPAPPHEPWRLR